MRLLKNTAKPKMIDWLLFIAIGVVCHFSFLYMDITTTTLHGIDFWNTNIFNFYSYEFNKTGFYEGFLHPHAAYPLPMYIIFAIWNFPLWVLTKFFGVKLIIGQTYIYFLWAKLILVPFIVGAAYYVYKICQELKIDNDRAKWCVLVFLSSLNLIVPVFFISQYDIIYVPFMLMGVLALLQDKEKSFLLWFALAISMKNFALFPFIVLVFLKEKDFYKIPVKILAGCSILLFFTIIASFDPAYAHSVSFTKYMIEKIFVNTISGFSGFSINMTLYILICILAYTRDISDKLMFNRWAIYLSMISLVSFFTFIAGTNYYWIVLTTPFIAIVIFQNPKYLNLNIILTTIAEFGMVVWTTEKISWFFEISVINNLGVFPKLFTITGTRPHTSLGIVNEMADIFGTLYFACMLAFIIITYPRKEENIINNGILEVVDRQIIWVRMGLSIALLLGFYFIYFYIGPALG